MSKCVISDPNNDLEDIYRRVDNSVPPERLSQLKDMVRFLVEEDPQSERQYNKSFKAMRRKFNTVPKKSHLIHAYSKLVREGEILAAPHGPAFRQWLTRKAGKSNSGVLVITVLTSPYPQFGDEKPQRFSCEWNCYYCPNEPGQPRSYLHDEPAVLRANRNKFDPILQFHDRAITLAMNGHPVDIYKQRRVNERAAWSCNLPFADGRLRPQLAPHFGNASSSSNSQPSLILSFYNTSSSY